MAREKAKPKRSNATPTAIKTGRASDTSVKDCANTGDGISAAIIATPDGSLIFLNVFNARNLRFLPLKGFIYQIFGK